MTHERHPANEIGKRGQEQAMEERLEHHLRFYYGPELPEHPLPESSWQQVFSQLGSQRQRSPQRGKRHVGRRFWPRFKRRRWWGQTFPQYGNAFPSDVQEALVRIFFEAHLSPARRMLVCRSSARVQTPKLGVSLVRRSPLRLTLPTLSEIKPAALDVLLAGGLARYEEMRRPTSLLVYACSMAAIGSLLVWMMIAFVSQGQALFTRFFEAIACISLTGAILWLLERQGRRLAQRADNQMIRRIGRFRACQGLHALADQSPAPSRRRWGELSLTERIARICGSPVAVQEQHLTLVR